MAEQDATGPANVDPPPPESGAAPEPTSQSAPEPASVPASDVHPVEIEFDAEQRHYEQAWEQLWPWLPRVARMVWPALVGLMIMVVISRDGGYPGGLAVGCGAFVVGLVVNRAREQRGYATRSWQQHFDRPVRYRMRLGPDGLSYESTAGSRRIAWADVLDIRRGPDVVTFGYRQPVVVWAPAALLPAADLDRVEGWWRAARASADRTADAAAPARTWWRGGWRSRLAAFACFAVPVGAGLLAPAAWSFYDRHSGPLPCRLLTGTEIKDAVGISPLSHEAAADPFISVPGAGSVPLPEACYWLLPQGAADVPPLVSVRASRHGADLYRQSIASTEGAVPVGDRPGETGLRMILDEGEAVALLKGDRLVVVTSAVTPVTDEALLDLARTALGRLA